MSLLPSSLWQRSIHDLIDLLCEGGSSFLESICDLLQEKGPSNFAFLTAFQRSQLSLTAFQKFDAKKILLKLG